MGSKKKKKGRNKPTEAPSPLTQEDTDAIGYLGLQQLEQMDDFDGIEAWKTRFRISYGSPTSSVKLRAQEIGRILMEESKRGPGRPPKDSNRQKIHPDAYKVADAVRNYIVYHPGAMVKTGERFRYSDDFRKFTLGLLAPDGLAGNMTVEEAAVATGIPYNTIISWISSQKEQEKHGDE